MDDLSATLPRPSGARPKSEIHSLTSLHLHLSTLLGPSLNFPVLRILRVARLPAIRETQPLGIGSKMEGRPWRLTAFAWTPRVIADVRSIKPPVLSDRSCGSTGPLSRSSYSDTLWMIAFMALKVTHPYLRGCESVLIAAHLPYPYHENHVQPRFHSDSFLALLAPFSFPLQEIDSVHAHHGGSLIPAWINKDLTVPPPRSSQLMRPVCVLPLPALCQLPWHSIKRTRLISIRSPPPVLILIFPFSVRFVFLSLRPLAIPLALSLYST